MKILVLTTGSFAPTHTPKLIKQMEYLGSFSDIEITIRKDTSLSDIEYLIMTQHYDCVYPTTVFEYSPDGKHIIAFNKTLYQILEYHHQHYIGSKLFTHMLLNDKALTNYRCNMSLPNKLLTRVLWEKRRVDAITYITDAPFPVLVKPNTLAASLGISKASVAHCLKEAVGIIDRQFQQFPNITELLLEHYLNTADEFTVSVTGNGPRALCSVTALLSNSGEYEMFSYQNKNLQASKRSVTYSSDMNNNLKSVLKDRALSLARLLNIRDYCRFDFLRNNDGQIYLIDANSLPALGSNYMLEYVNRNMLQEKQIFSLLLTVFCKRTGIPYPSCLRELPDEILRQIL